MTHSVKYDPVLHFIETKFQGNIFVNEVVEIYSEAMRLAKEQNCFSFLSDYRDATMKLSTLDIYELPKRLSEVFGSSGIPAYQLKRALVVTKDLEDYHFFEVVSSNQGQVVKLFQEYTEAKEWLLST